MQSRERSQPRSSLPGDGTPAVPMLALFRSRVRLAGATDLRPEEDGSVAGSGGQGAGPGVTVFGNSLSFEQFAAVVACAALPSALCPDVPTAGWWTGIVTSGCGWPGPAVAASAAALALAFSAILRGDWSKHVSPSESAPSFWMILW